MYSTDLIEARMAELRHEGRLAASGRGLPRRPNRVVARLRRLAHRDG